MGMSLYIYKMLISIPKGYKYKNESKYRRKEEGEYETSEIRKRMISPSLSLSIYLSPSLSLKINKTKSQNPTILCKNRLRRFTHVNNSKQKQSVFQKKIR